MNLASPRAPSPLRQSQTQPASTSTGIDPDFNDSDSGSESGDDDEREHDSAASVSQIAVNFAHKVGTFVGGMTSPSPSPSPMMTSSEIEREAQRERERGIREAERIMQAENNRSTLEDRVMAMLDSTRALPPPPSRSQTLPNPSSTPSSPSSGTSWWSAAKNRLTPTKDKDLTPAQQVIQDVKRTEKERDKAEKEYQKDIKRLSKGKEKEWPANPQTKYNDPAFFNLNVPQTPTPYRRSGSPTSPSPNPNPASGRVLGSPSAAGSPGRPFTAPNLTPSPNRSMTSNGTGASPGRADQPPLYAQFNTQGGLDVHLTLITIAKRFEKLEKWTVGHVRALEERMGDVERWLVDKEEREQKERGSKMTVKGGTEKADKDDEESDSVLSKRDDQDQISVAEVNSEVHHLRDEVLELQGRIGELGREMAEMSRERALEKVHPEKLSSSNASRSTTVREASPPPTTSAFASIESVSPGTNDWPNLHKRVPSVRESTSPPLLRSLSRQTTGSRLPYPTGDYAPPPPDAAGPGAGGALSGTFSPPSSPPGSLNTRTPTRRPVSVYSGMPTTNGIGLGLVTAGTGTGTGTGTGGAGMSSSASTYSTSYSNASFSSVSSISPSTSPSPSPRPQQQPQSTTSTTSPKAVPKGSRVLPKPPSHSSSPSSPGARKRYTVALGTPITRSSAMLTEEAAAESESSFINGAHAQPDFVDGGAGGMGLELAKKTSNSSLSMGRAFFSSSPVSVGRSDDGNEFEDAEEEFAGDETIGKASSRSAIAALKEKKKDREEAEANANANDTSDSFTPTHSRIRAQSAYGFSSIVQQSQSGSQFRGGENPMSGSVSASANLSGSSIGTGAGGTKPLKPRLRSQSTSPSPMSSVSSSTSSKFVDPLVLRRQEAESKHGKLAMPRPLSGKVPIGQLVKFFDGERKR